MYFSSDSSFPVLWLRFSKHKQSLFLVVPTCRPQFCTSFHSAWVIQLFFFLPIFDILAHVCLFLSDVYIDVPDTIDISHMRSKGMQPGEELLPEGG